MATQRIALTGATGLIGRRLVDELQRAGAEITVLTRNPEGARRTLSGEVQAAAWDPLAEPAPAAALESRDAVVHLAGENVAQRWSARAKQAIRESRVQGTANLLAGLAALPAGARPHTLVSSSAIGYYGPHGSEPIDEEAPPGEDFLAQVCLAWEQRAEAAAELGPRVVRVRTGVVHSKDGGALAKMLPAFRLGVGGPVAGGGQFIPWIHLDDVVGIYLAAIEHERWSGPVNATAPMPVSNREFSHALGRALHRPSLLPVPGVALRLLYGEMAEIVTEGARVMPARPLMLGYEFRHPELDGALRSALGR
ncbi:MAG: TIGR01777 family oxidoreductase [Solirubrobacteraceae bacterium]